MSDDEMMDVEESKQVKKAENKDLKETKKPVEFAPLSANELEGGQTYSKVLVPPNRRTPLRNQWMKIYQPIVENLKLQIRYNIAKHCVELRTSDATTVPGALQKATDFVRAFILGFEIPDAIALLRLDDLYIDSFDFKDVRLLEGEHLSRAIGRVAGQGGKTKYTIENSTKTRIVLAETHVHILGSFQNIKVAKGAIVRLIMGSPPGKVYTQMRNVANKNKERF